MAKTHHNRQRGRWGQNDRDALEKQDTLVRSEAKRLLDTSLERILPQGEGWVYVNVAATKPFEPMCGTRQHRAARYVGREPSAAGAAEF